MSYKEQIIEMVEGIENTATLKYLLCVIESYLKSRRILESQGKEGRAMDYKRLIFEAVEKIEDEWILEQIYRCITNITKE